MDGFLQASRDARRADAAVHHRGKRCRTAATRPITTWPTCSASARQRSLRLPLPAAWREHAEADCFAHFAGRLNSFFYGEHPTRISYYEPAELFSARVQPARTVYAGNYVFRPAALKYFIPFASLRLRMSGPTLGRLVKAELGPRFVSANLPMLHKRTVESGGQAEFRPGIETRCTDYRHERRIRTAVLRRRDAVHHRRAAAHLAVPPAPTFPMIDAVREEMLEKYNARQQAILNRLASARSPADDPTRWWNAITARSAQLRHFCANVRRNFGTDSPGHLRINAADNWARWRTALLEAIARYPADRQAWEQVLCAG